MSQAATRLQVSRWSWWYCLVLGSAPVCTHVSLLLVTQVALLADVARLAPGPLVPCSSGARACGRGGSMARLS